MSLATFPAVDARGESLPLCYNRPRMVEIVGNIHMHTRYSDGAGWHQDILEAASAAELDYVVVTDHNLWVEGLEGYYDINGRPVLLLIGEEVHDMRREPQANHCLVIGAEREMAPNAADPQHLIDAVRAAGGYTFLAHPFEPDAPAINEPNYGWKNWEIDGFTGLEIWNYMSHLKQQFAHGMWRGVRAAYHPERYIEAPTEDVLRKWDELLSQGKRVAAIGGSDGHALTYSLGPLRRTLFPYEFMFRAVNTHLILEEPLSGNFALDKPRVLEAIGNGRSWVGYDMAHPTQGFKFTAQSLTKGSLGDQIKLDAGGTLQVLTPRPCNIRVVHNGQTVAQVDNDFSLAYLPTDPGAYRVECKILYEKKVRGWIYSNPIYLVE